MNTLFSILCIVAISAGCIASLVKFIHFFQLNSYRASLQLRWIRLNVSKIIPNFIIGIIALSGAIIGGFGGKIIFLATAVLGCLTSISKKAKKPLVYTMRVKRLIATNAVLYIIAIALGIAFGRVLVFSALFFLLMPLVIIAANFVNMPMEKAITNYYINDAKKMLSGSNARVIGITGSYGKTSVKYYLTTLLKAKYNVLMTPESYNTPMGVVKTIRSSLNAFHEIFVCEMGAKRVGEIKEICDIVSPEMGVITSVGPQHLQTFKSLDNVKKTKFELADALPEGGALFLNCSDKNINDHKGTRQHIGYSINGNAPYNVEEITVSEKGSNFKLCFPSGEKHEFSTKLIGEHNVLNIAGAIAVAHTLGIEPQALKLQVAKLQSVPHRLELVARGNDIIIDDAYNSNPSGTKAALSTLSCFEGFKILLTPGMVELGEKQAELNCAFGEDAAKVCDYVILVGKNSEPIAEGLAKASYPEEKTYRAQTFTEAIEHAYSINSYGQKKIILLENDLPDNY